MTGEILSELKQFAENLFMELDYSNPILGLKIKFTSQTPTNAKHQLIKFLQSKNVNLSDPVSTSRED